MKTQISTDTLLAIMDDLWFGIQQAEGLAELASTLADELNDPVELDERASPQLQPEERHHVLKRRVRRSLAVAVTARTRAKENVSRMRELHRDLDFMGLDALERI